MQRQFLLLAALLPFFTFGQHNFGVKINPGVSYFTTKLESYNTDQKFYPMPSGQGGLFYDYRFASNYLLTAELLYLRVDGKEYMKIMYFDSNGNLTGEYGEDWIWRHVSFVGIPVYAGYSYNKWNVNLGIQTNFVIESGGREKGNATINGEYHSFENKSDQLGIDKISFGPRAGAIYKLNDRFSLEANYYYGVNNLLSPDPISESWKWRVQQLTVGVRFNLLATNVPSTESGKK